MLVFHSASDASKAKSNSLLAKNMPTKRGKLWIRYYCACHGRAILKTAVLVETGVTMEAESSQRKDTLKVEKLSLLVLALCAAVLVYLLVARPF